jgi:tetratricopeptide (TPR) repeat protein
MSERTAQFRQKLSSSPENILLKFSLAQSLFEEEQWDESIKYFLECLEKKPDWMLSALFLGKAYLEKENYPKAQKFLELTVRLGEEQDHVDPVEEAKGLLRTSGNLL